MRDLSRACVNVNLDPQIRWERGDDIDGWDR